MLNYSENKLNQATWSIQAYQTTVVEDSRDNFLNKEYMKMLKKLLLQLEDLTIGSCLVA